MESLTRRMPQKMIVGWKEVIRLPQLNDMEVRAKIDTGAKTSALHADNIETFERDGVEWVRFQTLNERPINDEIVTCEAPVYDRRVVRSSNGMAEERIVIKTLAVLGEHQWKIQLTLTTRTNMEYPMLLGRRAMEHHILVAPGASYVQGQP